MEGLFEKGLFSIDPQHAGEWVMRLGKGGDVASRERACAAKSPCKGPEAACDHIGILSL